jgi:hypothetical protein
MVIGEVKGTNGREEVMTARTVAVIGAGPTGITTIKNFSDLGFAVTGFERCAGVGGNWRFDDPSGHSSVFETTHIISSKYTSSYEDFPLPADAPDYPSHTYLLDYFTRYAMHFGIDRKVRFGTEVEHCEPANGRWSVSWRDLGSGERRTETFDALAVCNGHHHKPRMPLYPGTFTGELLHSHDYKRAAPFRDKRVLVIGGGNSACDAAVETARVSARTVISWRRGYYLFPKFMFGMPVDKFFYQFRFLPTAMQLMGLRFTLWLLQGRNRDIGLPDPTQDITATHPTLNSDLYHAIRHGDVFPKGDIARFDDRRVHFKDGSSEEFDTVIACTGYWISHPFFDSALVDFSQGPVPLLHRMIPEKLPNLYFIGLFQPLGCIWPGAELQAKLAARHLAGLWKPDGDLGMLIRRELADPDVHQLETPRHTITVNDLAFRKRLRRELKRAKAPAGTQRAA